MNGFLNLLPIILIFGIAAFFIFRKLNYFTKNRSFDDFKAKHPESIKDGKVHCPNCQSDSIWLKEIGKTPRSILHSHVCRQCGTELYRSVLNA